MKKIFTLFVGVALLSSPYLKAEDVELFREEFEFVTETWYGAAGKDVVLTVEEFELYCTNPGWTGVSLTLAAPTDGTIPFNDIPAPRVGTWNGNNNITTPTIDCTGYSTVKVSCLLKRVSRSVTNQTLDNPNIKFLHAADGVNFVLVEDVVTVLGTEEGGYKDMTAHSFIVTGVTKDSKFRWNTSIDNSPNRFFIDDVVVTPDTGSALLEAESEGNYTINYDGDVVSISGNNSLANVQIVGLTGQVVYSGQSSTIDVAALNAGVYLIKVTSDNGETTVKKIVKR